jgi:hypothetical protein
MISIDPALQLQDYISSGFVVESEGENRVVVSMPFIFDDGDQMSICAIRGEGGIWQLTDEGDVLQRTTERMARRPSVSIDERLQSLIDFYGVSATDGALRLNTTTNTLSEDIFTFAQTCLEASWLGKSQQRASRHAEKVAFNEALSGIVKAVVGKDRVSSKWHDPVSDPDRLYPVDLRIHCRDTQLFLFGVSSPVHCAEATITCLHHKNAGTKFKGVVVYEEETEIAKKHADRLNDVADRRFSRISESKTIAAYLKSFAA